MYTFAKFSLLFFIFSLAPTYAADAKNICEESKFFFGNDKRVFKEFTQSQDFYACSSLAPTPSGNQQLLLILENLSTGNLDCEVDFQVNRLCSAFSPREKAQQKFLVNAQEGTELLLATSDRACSHALQISCRPQPCRQEQTRFLSDEPFLSEIKLGGEICLGQIEQTTCDDGVSSTFTREYKGIYSLSSEKNELYCEEADLCFIGSDAYRVGELFSIEKNRCSESFECRPGGELLSLARVCR